MVMDPRTILLRKYYLEKVRRILMNEGLNPYLPSYEYVADGEAHVFGDRIYLYGSHDRFDGVDFCLNDYVCYSADVNNLSDWKYEGVIYKKEQDPHNQNIPADAKVKKSGMFVKAKRPEQLNPPGMHALFAPDVVRGPDGRYYLYYCTDCFKDISVAVCETPAGKFEFLDYVRDKKGEILGYRDWDFMQFDPAVLIDDKTIYLYSGNAARRKTKKKAMASQVMKLEEDMITLKEEPRELLPDVSNSEDTCFKGHEFFEASSIRKVQGKYYFVYSSVNSHELCYAISDKPDREYQYGGTIVDIGDVYLNGRKQKDALNALGNTHGGMEYVNGQWYIFYHRQTNRTMYSRQGCAEKISFNPDGSIPQAEVTSCGLRDGLLKGVGKYPAYCCCHLTGKNGTMFSLPYLMGNRYPYLTQDIPDAETDGNMQKREEESPVQYVKNIKNGATIGFKYFSMCGAKAVKAQVRGKAKGVLCVSLGQKEKIVAKIPIELNSNNWVQMGSRMKPVRGEYSLYFTYKGSGSLDLNQFELLM